MPRSIQRSDNVAYYRRNIKNLEWFLQADNIKLSSVFNYKVKRFKKYVYSLVKVISYLINTIEKKTHVCLNRIVLMEYNKHFVVGLYYST